MNFVINLIIKERCVIITERYLNEKIGENYGK